MILINKTKIVNMEKAELSKRKRSENWNEEDKILLKNLVRPRIKIIDNKKTDTNTNLLKKKTWMEVEKRFNSLCSGHKRSVIQLKYQWVATKSAARRQDTDPRNMIAKPEDDSQFSEFKESSNDDAAWLSNEVVDNCNEFDSDGINKDISVRTEMITVKEEEATEEEFKTDDELEPKSIPKTKKKAKKGSVTEANINKLTEFDIKCRRELHQLQLEAERKRIRNLDREYDLIEAKIKCYQKNLLVRK